MPLIKNRILGCSARGVGVGVECNPDSSRLMSSLRRIIIPSMPRLEFQAQTYCSAAATKASSSSLIRDLQRRMKGLNDGIAEVAATEFVYTVLPSVLRNILSSCTSGAGSEEDLFRRQLPRLVSESFVNSAPLKNSSAVARYFSVICFQRQHQEHHQ